MENIERFYADLQNHINNKIKEKDSLEVGESGYRIIPRMNVFQIRSHINNIANKIFSINKEDRIIYANLIVEAIDMNYVRNLSRANQLDDLYIETIYKDEDTGHFFDSWLIEHDNYTFTLFVSEIFLKFGVSLHDIAESKSLETCLYEVLPGNTDKLDYCNPGKKNRDFTTTRQVLAIEYLLSKLGIDSSNTDKTVIARFIQFLTGRQPDLLPQNTSIYSFIGGKNISSKAYNNDCDFVAGEFDKLGLGEIADLIRNGKE